MMPRLRASRRGEFRTGSSAFTELARGGDIFPNEPLETSIDSRLRALSHHHRLRILAMVTARPVSATDVAANLGIAHASASYHLHQLAAAGLIVVAGGPQPQPRANGRPKQFYKMRTDPFRGLGPRTARLLDRAMLSDLELRLRQPGTTRTVSDAEVWLKPRDWRRLVDLIGQASTIVHERGQAARTRGAKHVSATTLLLEFRE